jgi:hypothetical protein
VEAPVADDFRAVSVLLRFLFPRPQNGVVMSMQPRPWPDVPELTAREARSFPKGNLAMRIREELGEVYADARFAAAFGVRGRPGISPGQLEAQGSCVPGSRALEVNDGEGHVMRPNRETLSI